MISKMAFSWKKRFLVIVIVLFIIITGHIAMTRTCSSQTIAILVRFEFITGIEVVMLILSMFIWKTFAPLFNGTSSVPNQTEVSVARNNACELNTSTGSSRSLLRKKKNSEVDLSGLNSEYGGQTEVTSKRLKVGNIVLFVYLMLCHTSYLTNLFLVGTDPHWFSMIAYASFGSYIQLITGLVILKVFVFLVGFIGKIRNSSRYSSLFSQKNIAIIAFIYMLAASTFGLYTASQPPAVKHVTVRMKNLSSDLEGLTIVQLSDIHLGPTVGLSKLEKIVKIVNDENPDIIVLTGDLVDAPVEILRKAAYPLQELHSKYGKFFVSGNHEYYTGDVDNWFIYLQDLGFTVLHNSNVKIPPTVLKNQSQICLAGTDDVQADVTKYTGHKFDLAKAVGSCAIDRPVILLAHQPYAAKVALDSKYRIDLVLSGHTHGGQMFPLILGAYLFNPFYAGLYQYGEKGGFVYVSQGTQYWGIPMRIATSMEIARITLLRTG